MNCPICLTEDEEEKMYVVFPCRHKCCLDCFVCLKKFECMLCRKNVDHLVPTELKERIDLTSLIRYNSIVNDNDFYLAILGSRLRQQILRARLVRRLRNDTEVPLLLDYNSDD
jgi:hypothetical protein